MKTNPRQLGNFISGSHVPSRSTEFGEVFNPSRGEVIATVPHSTVEDVDDAVEDAAHAFEGWSATPALRRAAILFRYKELLESHFSELSRLVTLENGKTLPEAEGDLRRGIEVVEFACGAPHLLKGETLPQVAKEIDAMSSREPIGVCAGITPFNFPAMVPMWMFPVAIACGNTFVLKPSEKVPLTALRLAELFLEAGAPKGVLNVVNGARDVVDRLCMHPSVAALSFVGSSRVAEHVYTLGTAHGKRVQAAGGAKNVMVVMPDANPDSSLRAIMGAAFGCAGQRCMAGSVVLGVGEAAAGIGRRLTEAMGRLKMLPTDEFPESEMGPVIDGASRERLQASIAAAEAEGARIAADGRAMKLPPRGFFVGPTLIDKVSPEMNVVRSELFGPVLALAEAGQLDDAIAWIQASGYGNGAVIFTQSGSSARKFAREAPCGMIGVNVGVPAPMAVFSFSGWNRSFFGDLHVQGMEGFLFYTRQKVVFTRWDDAYVRTQGW